MTAVDPTITNVSCTHCGAGLQATEDPCPCGSTRRTVGLAVAITAKLSLAAHMAGKFKSDERTPSRRRALERDFGEDFHRDSGTWRRVTREFDRKNDRYRETIEDDQGVVVREVDEPLSVHQERGTAKPK